MFAKQINTICLRIVLLASLFHKSEFSMGGIVLECIYKLFCQKIIILKKSTLYLHQTSFFSELEVLYLP